MTSHVTWLDIISQCKQKSQQELEQEQHRYSIELLSAAVRDVFQRPSTTDDTDDKNDNSMDAPATATAADDEFTIEYSHILQ